MRPNMGIGEDVVFGKSKNPTADARRTRKVATPNYEFLGFGSAYEAEGRN
jgi:hypothetical protein